MPQTTDLKGTLRICNNCGNPYEPMARNQRFCSVRCGQIYRGDIKAPNGSQKICAFCKNKFQARSKDTIFCSNACRRQARETKFNKSVIEWKSLREFILERDNYTCQDCGKFFMDIGLEVHHIILLRSRGTNKESNLITLCHECHKKRHKVK